MHPHVDCLCLDTAALRERVSTATGRWRAYVDHILWIAEHAPEYPQYRIQAVRAAPEGLVRPFCRPDESAYTCFAYALTGDRAFADRGRRHVLELADSVAVRERHDWCQMHTWCDAFPCARWLVYYDWIWDSGAFCGDDHARLKERFLYYLRCHVAPRLKARAIEHTHCNNQNAAMAFACVLGGYLWGLKHDRDPTAGQLLELGMPHLVRFLTGFPRGGYSFEGSTYMGQVNACVMPLGLDLVTAVSGVDLWESRESDDCASVRETFESIMRLLTPGGLVLPWDNYGYELALFAPAAAYLAKRTGAAGTLAYLDQLGLVEQPGHHGWGFDKTIWTLAYAPELPRDATLDNLNHAEASVGAGAVGPEQRLHVYQMWDRSHWPPLRAHFNPNSLVMTYDGVPLVLDGRCLEAAKDSVLQDEAYMIIRPDLDRRVSIGSGSVGAHNALFFDGDDAFAAERETQGRLLGAAYAAGSAAIESEVASCYAGRYDVHSVRRSFVLVDDDLVLVRDRVSARSCHRVSWRLHLREGTLALADGCAHLETAEHVHLFVCTPNSDPFQHRHFVAAEPARAHGQLESACHEITREAQGREVEFVTLLAPVAGWARWRALSSGWQWQYAASREAAEAALAEARPGVAIDLDQGPWFFQTDEHRPGFGLYTLELCLPEALPERLWLRLPRVLRTSYVHVNDRCFCLPLAPEEVQLLPPVVDITAAVRAGVNRLALILHSSFEAVMHGTPELLVPAAVRAPTIRRVDEAVWAIDRQGTTCTVSWQGQRVRIERDGRPPVVLDLVPPAPSTAVVAPDPAEAVAAAQRAFASLPQPERPSDEQLAVTIREGRWPEALDALECAARAPTPALVAAAEGLLAAETARRVTGPVRASDDVVWYRLKAGAIRVLAAARYEPATQALGETLLGNDFYPVRVAAADALGAIGTPAAQALLNRVPPHDETNLVWTVRRYIQA